MTWPLSGMWDVTRAWNSRIKSRTTSAWPLEDAEMMGVSPYSCPKESPLPRMAMTAIVRPDNIEPEVLTKARPER